MGRVGEVTVFAGLTLPQGGACACVYIRITTVTAHAHAPPCGKVSPLDRLSNFPVRWNSLN